MEQDQEVSAISRGLWDEMYREGHHVNRYPYDSVVAYFARHAPRNRPPQQIGVVEVGFGAGNNLWFAAREGFRVAGVEAAPAGVEHARARFAAEGLAGDLRQGDFRALPFADRQFALAVNRGALPYIGFTGARKAVEEVWRVLEPGGTFYNWLYSDQTSFEGTRGADGSYLDVKGSTASFGPTTYYGKRDLEILFDGWDMLELVHSTRVIHTKFPFLITGLWELVVRKPG